MKPVVFIGPSIEVAEARQLIDAEFRPPCRRGDVATIPPGRLVGLIDGVFHQAEAVSPREIRDAIRRGVEVFGASSMGALRALEVPGVHGIGHVVEMYRNKWIDSDDEVAVAFDPETMRPLTVPLVNVRYAARRLYEAGTIGDELCRRIVDAAQRLHYTDRTYRLILRSAGVADEGDLSGLVDLLKAIDLKRDDARLLLQTLCVESVRRAREAQHRPEPSGDVAVLRAGDRAPDMPQSDGRGLLVWEVGHAIADDEFIDFLALTGVLTRYAWAPIVMLMLRNQLGLTRVDVPPVSDIRHRFGRLCNDWGWNTAEEIHRSLADFGLDVRQVARHLRQGAYVDGVMRGLLQTRPRAFVQALLAAMAADDLALKREVMRCVSLRGFGCHGGKRLRALAEGRDWMCRQHGVSRWRQLRKRLTTLGVSTSAIERHARALGAARAAAKTASRPIRVSRRTADACAAAFGIASSTKPAGEWRFAQSHGDAARLATAIASKIGVTRIGMIDRLANQCPVHVSQVARPEGAWSSSYGSGKSESKEGAVIGGVMEEAEKWAQERYVGAPTVASYLDLREAGAIDPWTLDLPYDSPYSESLECEWQRCHDLLSGRLVWMPLAALTCPFNLKSTNIYYSKRGARGVFSTNGLASGFSLVEAVVHGACEYIERHAVRMAELALENPGGGDESHWPSKVDPKTLAEVTQRVLAELGRVGITGGIWDITSNVAVPTMTARLVIDRAPCRGSAAHPNPRVAAHMALLEAVQAAVILIAGGREDLTIHTRSLGRHERPRPMRDRAMTFWNRPSRTKSIDTVPGCVASDLYDEFLWIRSRLAAAGSRSLIVVDLSREDILPARVVRVVVPGLETSSPFYSGNHARLALIADLTGSASARAAR